MSKPYRNTSTIDYKVFHQTGRKVAKLDAQYTKLAERLDKDINMDRNQLVDENNMIVIEIKDFLEEYELDDLYGTDNIEKCILELKDIKRKFESVHVKLRRILDDEYNELYGNYDGDVRKMLKWIKDARKGISRRKREKDVEREL